MGRFQEPRWLRATHADRGRRLMLQGCPLFGALLILGFVLAPIAGPGGQADTLTMGGAADSAASSGAEALPRSSALALSRVSSPHLPQPVAVQVARPPAQVEAPPCAGLQRPP